MIAVILRADAICLSGFEAGLTDLAGVNHNAEFHQRGVDGTGTLEI
jgi:hypothetical protein